jgi:hypothetical protein
VKLRDRILYPLATIALGGLNLICILAGERCGDVLPDDRSVVADLVRRHGGGRLVCERFACHIGDHRATWTPTRAPTSELGRFVLGDGINTQTTWWP